MDTIYDSNFNKTEEISKIKYKCLLCKEEEIEVELQWRDKELKNMKIMIQKKDNEVKNLQKYLKQLTLKMNFLK